MPKTLAQRRAAKAVKSSLYWTDQLAKARSSGEPDEQLMIAMQWLFAALRQLSIIDPAKALEKYIHVTDQLARFSRQIQNENSQ